MIQDIAPKKLHNEYHNLQPEDGDLVLFFDGNRAAVRASGKDVSRGQEPALRESAEEIRGVIDDQRAEHDRQETSLQFPSYGEVKDMDGFSPADCQYLFDISGEKYFLYRGELPEGLLAKTGATMENVRMLRYSDPEAKARCFAAATGYHLAVWYRDNRFCGRCGGVLRHDRHQRMLKCPVCGNEVYPKIAPAVIVAVTSGEKLLLTKYSGRVYKRYALIAGFTEIGETAEETVEREVMEEVGLRVKNIRYYATQPWGTDSNLLIGYFADLDGDPDITLDHDELAVAEWFDREDIPIGNDQISLTLDMVQAFREGREPQ